MGTGKFDWKPIVCPLVAIFAIIIAVYLFVDSEELFGESDSVDYFFEINPFIKACLVLIGTNM